MTDALQICQTATQFSNQVQQNILYLFIFTKHPSF